MIESLYHLAVGWKGGKPDLGAICFWLKNRRPSEWRDVQNINADVGHYILSDKPKTDEQWIAERATVESKRKLIDASPVVTETPDDTANPLD